MNWCMIKPVECEFECDRECESIDTFQANESGPNTNIKSSELYQNLLRQWKKRGEDLKRLRRDNSDLITKLVAKNETTN